MELELLHVRRALDMQLCRGEPSETRLLHVVRK